MPGVFDFGLLAVKLEGTRYPLLGVTGPAGLEVILATRHHRVLDMAEVIQFSEHKALLARKHVPAALPAPPARTVGDDDHDVAHWLSQADRWGWEAAEFKASDSSGTGYLIQHEAGADKAKPMYALIRVAEGWKLFNRQREWNEFPVLADALQSIFPSALLTVRA